MVEGEEQDYESDPEDALLPSAMRRREASDDEDGDRSERGEKLRRDRLVGIGPEGELDDEGAAPEYEDEEEFDGDEYEEYEEEGEEEFEEEGGLVDGGSQEIVASLSPVVLVRETEGDGQKSPGEAVGHDSREAEVLEEEEFEGKKENVPYAVPTVGAFYMHDDRVGQNGRGRQRRLPGGRKLWESKDNQAWVHDRFEELNLQDAGYGEDRRASRGRFRGRGGGRGRGQGVDHGFVKGNRSQVYDDSNYQVHVPKIVRGRGPRRYQPLAKSNKDISEPQHKQYIKYQEPRPNTIGGRQSSDTPSVQPDPSLSIPHKNIFASSLNSASPPFYPSGSSNQDVSLSQKRDGQPGSANKTVPSSTQMVSKTSAPESGSFVRRKANVDSAGHDNLYMNDLICPAVAKTLATSPSSVPSFTPNLGTKSSQTKGQTRGMTVAGLYAPMNSSFNQVARASPPNQTPIAQQRMLPSVGLPSRLSTQLMGQRPVIATATSSPPEAPSRNSSEIGEGESPPGSSKSRNPLDGKEKTSNAVTGMGSFLYNSSQVLGATGAMGLTHVDQGFAATPAYLPVMQFGGQHPGGIPAVGMALPGYVAQQQLGFGNSEMTWLPVLAGAAGALGASYCSPYIALDNSYYARSSGQTSSSISSKETSINKSADSSKSPQIPETVNDEFGQRQNKPRSRYSEMNFGQ
ncbi:putative Btz domain, protein MLN51 plant [Dioscorea sansibarensis]